MARLGDLLDCKVDTLRWWSSPRGMRGRPYDLEVFNTWVYLQPWEGDTWTRIQVPRRRGPCPQGFPHSAVGKGRAGQCEEGAGVGSLKGLPSPTL